MIVIPRVTVMSLAEMSAAAVTALGPLLARTTRAIETVVRPERVYCALFAESERRVHFHLLPRTAWLAAQYAVAYPEAAGISGPLLFEWARRTFNQPIPGQNREEVNGAIRRLLAAEIA
ncbi:MAG TPA: hypothetical protein VL527_16960 [Dongiaceae bacterium]|nr:hypothetical protein [Dongiaceae bacterium]